MTTSGIARMSKLCGHSMGTFSNTHLLGELHGHASAMKIICTLRLLLRPFLATNTILSVLLPVWSLNVHMKVIAHANNWSLTLAFLTRGTSEFYLGTGLGMSGCSYATGLFLVTTLIITPYSYSLLLQCWDGQPEERPDFSQLVVTISTIMEAVAGYLIFSASDKENFALDTSLLFSNSTGLDCDSKKLKHST